MTERVVRIRPLAAEDIAESATTIATDDPNAALRFIDTPSNGSARRL